MPWAEVTSGALDQEWPDAEQTMTEWPDPAHAAGQPPAADQPPATDQPPPAAGAEAQPKAIPSRTGPEAHADVSAQGAPTHAQEAPIQPAVAGAAAPAEKPDTEPPGEPPTEARPPAARLSGQDLADLEAFADLPEEMHEELARAARVEALAAEEEVAGFGVALVLDGEASVCTSIVDTPALHAVARTLVPSRGSLADGMPLRVVAAAAGARVAVWDQSIIDDALRTCPWVVDELRDAADRLQALAGATIGPLGDLNEERLGAMLERLRLQVMHEGDVVVLSGHPMPGLVVVGAGTVELLEDGQESPVGAARPGDLIFAGALLMGQPAPATARAAAGGALLLVGEHRTLRELFEQIPELIPLLSEDT
jgi:hypothetical protein